MNLLIGYEHFIGGIAGGFVSTATCHPFDLLKIRYSANEGNQLRPKYSSYLDAIRKIYSANGVKGLYRGITPAVVAAPLSWGLYFHFYNRIRSFTNTSPKYPFFDNLLAGSITGGIILSLTNPFWVCKTRMCLQYEHLVNEKQFSGLVGCLKNVWKTEGLRGFYKGYIPGLIGTTNGAVQFAIYNRLKDYRCHSLGLAQDSQLKPLDYLLFSTLSKCSSTIITFPYQVLRTRLQDHHVKYTGTIDCFSRTLKVEGVFGFYKGCLAATIKQLPYSVITYIVYEQTRYYIERLSKT
uniref:Mitochondrial carrier protein n=1 Tax=Meloidogyne incognita TaxID=6306 RepID=A0A914NFA1_MELIC